MTPAIMDLQAQEYLKQKNWIQAIELYNKLLANKQNSLDQVINYLTDRTECFLELQNYPCVIVDTKSIIKLCPDQNSYYACLARKRLIHSLYSMKKFTEADMAARDWLIYLQESDINKDIKSVLESLLGNFINSTTTKQKALFLLKILDANFSNNYTAVKMEHPGATVCCIYCNVSFVDKLELRAHCQTETHEMMIMSDDGHDWFWRPPPRGFKSDDYLICENWRETGSCRYGIQCVQAHGDEELIEWRERFHYREMRLQRAREKELFGKSYTEELLEKWIQAPNPNTLMRDKIDEVEDHCSCSTSVTVSSKNSLHEWTFFLKTRRPLKAVALLQDTHRNHFLIANIMIKNCKIEPKNDQEWIASISNPESMLPVDYKVTVVFTAGIFGTFRQSVVFDFSSEPVLVKHLCVDVVPDAEIDKINEIRKEITVSISERWTSINSDILFFQSSLVNTSSNEEWEKRLRSLYPCPQAETFLLSHATLTEKKFTRNNYRERMHELLFVEEMARYELIAKYNLTTHLQIAHSYILSPNSMAASTAKYSSNGELFASVRLGKELSEDTSEGRLILMHCNTVYLSPKGNNSVHQQQHRRKVYEALIEDKGKNTIYLRLSSQTVTELRLTPDSDLHVEIQFQLNRIPYCEWHYTLDKMANFKMIFPETYLEPSIPWSPSRQWSRTLDSRLNIKQKEAVVAITTPLCVPLPPILVIGPFGTGKTFTLAQAIRELIKDSAHRILLCTHSNSAADLYIKDYLDQWVEAGDENARPLRIYYTKRWVTTVNPIVQKYCLIKNNGSIRTFEIPTIDDIMKHKIIVVTLSTSVYLSAMGLPQGFFTHILLDEAAQAIECETVTPLAVAHENTRIVLAGDHMQLGPDIFSTFAKERNLHISLLERLYDHYPAQFPCKILLCENYRAHESIIHFTSESFYDQKLVSSSKQPKHDKFYPLTFFTTRGEDVQDKNSTAFYNNSEVYEVVERVAELKRNWPTDWGTYNDQSIGVVTPYSDQVFRIRSELRKRRIDNVCVERVLNVQGKQFRAIILSTVRTRKTCTNNDSCSNNNSNSTNAANINNNNGKVDYGFLSNSKLLNTAITRAQSLVAVVGDPIALCSLGRCSKVWERFIQICNDNGSLFGITWMQLKLQLDGIELKKIYTLNPLAPEFIPRKYKEMGIIPPPPMSVQPATLPPLPNLEAALAAATATTTTTAPILPKEITAATGAPPANLVTQIVPPVAAAVVSPFPPPPLQDYRYIPQLIYQPQQARPFVFNIVPQPQAVPPMPQLTNGFTQQIRVVNPSQLSQPPLLVATTPRQQMVPHQQPMPPLPKTVQVSSTVLSPPEMHPSQSCSSGSNSKIQSGSNKLIQFMNNVHFPEATNVLNDCINLLPHNMSLADMLLQPLTMQERWYNYLRETTGLEAAEKFKYLLHTTNQKGMKVMDKNIFERSTPQSCESPTFSWFDSPTNQINFNKPVYMQENLPPEATATISNGGLMMNIGPSGKQTTSSIQYYSDDPSSSSSSSLPNGIVNHHAMSEAELQRHINEEFANLHISNSDVNEVFRALTVKNESQNTLQMNGGNNVTGPRFSKYFH